jgi:sterol 24-C-methyltransferase
MSSLTAPKPPTPKKEDYNAITSTYASRFGPNNDQLTVTDAERRKRQETAAEGTDQYYDFATSAYLSGWGEHFHYTPFAPGEPILQAMAFYEHRFAHLMALRPGMKVLDVGCGVGGPAREICKFIGCEIVGITINQRQVDRAVELTLEAGLSDKITFIQGDFLNLPFPDATFDAAYAIEATVHAPDLTVVYSGIARCLKPGAIFGLSEWVMTPSYDPENEKHIGIRNRVERGNAISNLQTAASCRQAMLNAGFTLSHDENYAEHWTNLGRNRSSMPAIPGGLKGAALPTHHAPIPVPTLRPWYYPLDGDTSLVETWADWWITWRMSAFARKLCWIMIWILEHLRLYPKGTLSAMATMAYCVDSVVEGGKEGCFTPCWWFIGRKDMSGTGNASRQGVIGEAAAVARAVMSGEASKQ